MWWTFFIIFFLISIFSSVVLYYAMKRLSQYELYFSQLQDVISFSTEKMKQVDASGHFESDYEVGFFFEEIKTIQTVLNNIFAYEEDKSLKDAETTDAKKKK